MQKIIYTHLVLEHIPFSVRISLFLLMSTFFFFFYLSWQKQYLYSKQYYDRFVRMKGYTINENVSITNYTFLAEYLTAHFMLIKQLKQNLLSIVLKSCIFWQKLVISRKQKKIMALTKTFFLDLPHFHIVVLFLVLEDLYFRTCFCRKSSFPAYKRILTTN